jgi:endonuclease YncB( thermonuclease family)
MKNLSLLALFLALSTPAFAAEQNWFNQPREKCYADRPLEKSATVEHAVDGDTVFVRISNKSYSVRMLNIDTPETHFEGQSQGKWGELAADRLKAMLPEGTKVTLNFGPEQCDKYGRILAHVFAGKLHTNKEMVREGLAVNLCYYPSVSFCEELGKLTEAAIKNRTGMFSDPNVELPYDFRRRISKRRGTSYVGNIYTKLVVGPERQNDVPVGARVFFPRADMIQPPYRLAK